MTESDPAPVPWRELSPGRQIALREAYARDPDCLTGTCSLEAKTDHFARWLAARGVVFGPDDLRAAHGART